MTIEKKYYFLFLLTKFRYLISLKHHQIIINKLDMNNKINAILNNFVTDQISDLISQKITNHDISAIKMMKEEIIRIDALTESYKYGFIEMMTYDEMKSILNYYIDDIWILKKTEQKLNTLFQKNNKYKKELTTKNKIIYFNPQN